jgi:hypothetical protein
MRRLLGVLRESGEETGLAPQPGVGELAALADSVRGAGLPVRLVIDGDHRKLPAAVGVSGYRIVQEALTNVLKHAGPTRAEVTVCCTDDALMIEVTDDGVGAAAASSQPAGSQAWGQGLVGMRERAAMFGGELRAGPRPGGGFAVHSRLPQGDEPPYEHRPPAPPAVPPAAPAGPSAPSAVPGVTTAVPAMSAAPAHVRPAAPGVPPAVSAAPADVRPTAPGVPPAPADRQARAGVARSAWGPSPGSAP